MKLVGKIETIYPVKEGINTLVVSKKYKNQARQEIAFTLFGDWEERLSEFDLGDQIEVTFQIKTKFVGDKAYTDLICLWFKHGYVISIERIKEYGVVHPLGGV
jgi:hypothetical protein